MVKLHTRTQQTPALIVTAWCAARATMNRVSALQIAHRLKKWLFSAATEFLPPQFCYDRDVG
jgi:hypothetical protein